MPKFYCDLHRPIEAESISEAAQTFALRKARQVYGSRATAPVCTMGSYATNGSCAEFSAFIGRTKGSETTGHNINFTVHRL